MPIAFNCPLCKETNSVGPEFAGRRGTCAFCGAAVIVPQASGEAQLVSQPAHAAPKNSSAAVWIIVAVVAGFVLLACGGMMIGLLLPAVNAARGRTACRVHEQAETARPGVAQLPVHSWATSSGGRRRPSR